MLPLGLDDEGSFDAKIHIKSSDKITSMKRKTYLDIVSSIYFDYTVNWYKAFLDVKEVESFEESAKSYFKLIKRKCDNKDNIEIVYNDCPIYDESVFISTTGHLPSSSKIRDYGKYPIIFFMIVILPIILTYIYNFLLKYIDVPLNTSLTLIRSIIPAVLSAGIAWIVSTKNHSLVQ